MTVDEIKNTFHEIIEKKQISHAYLFEGTNQDELDDLVTNILMNFFCANKSACGSCVQCKQILSRLSLQVFWIGDGENKIKKQDIKALITNLNVGNIIEDQRKVYVIRNGEHLGPEAGNALLKTLEEPPKNTVGILLTRNRSDVLPTLKSRCRAFYVDNQTTKLVNNELINIIKNGKKDELFLLSARLKKMPKNEALAILDDALKNIIINDYIQLADVFYETISRFKIANNPQLLIENLFIHIYEVL